MGNDDAMKEATNLIEPSSDAAAERQERVTERFQSTSAYWKNVYVGESVWGAIFEDRREFALDWVDGLGLEKGARVLEVGCGAGSLAAGLARRAYAVDAVDSSDAMVELTREHVDELGLDEHVAVTRADVHELPFDDNSFELVVALGVIPWLHSPARGVEEMARVIKPGGHLIFTSDNRMAAHHLLDPRLNPFLWPVKLSAKRLLRRTLAWQRPETARAYDLGFVHRWVSDAQLQEVRVRAIGFGPFSFLGHELLPQRAATRFHRFLQRLADRGFPLISSVGGQHLVLARKSPTMPGAA